MPEANGDVLVSKLQKADENIPIIVMSGYDRKTFFQKFDGIDEVNL